MTVFFVLVNIALTILSLWGVIGAYNSSTSFKDVTGIDVHAEAAWYLLPIVIAAISTQFESVKTIGGFCAVIVTLCGGYVVYDSWNDTVGNTQECVANAGLDLDKQNECKNDVLSHSER
jgi:hypothetical protein